MALTAGTRLGPYEILAPIGAGGMGEVWKARDTRLNRIVAIKRLKSTHSARFEQEARSIAALNHEHICQIHDIGPDYLVLEYIEGHPLRGPLPVEEALRLATQIAEALEAAHLKGVLHRDLKPANILVTPAGSAKLLDFGLAKQFKDSDETATIEGTVLGTAAYMAPEQAEGKPLDARSDVFSLGAVLYELVSGRRAFHGENSISTMAAILHKEPAPLEAPASLQAVVKKCLSKAPALRYQNMAELHEALKEAAKAPAEPPKQPSIAVLPFANMSRDADDEYFSDGLAEEIINALAQVAGLKVIARTSAFAFRGKDVDIRKIAEALGVETILEGSVRRAGNRVRITAQLIAASDGSHLWSQRYDYEMADVFALQDEVAAAIVGVLQGKLSVEAPRLRQRTPNPEAHEALLKARYYELGRTAESMARAKEAYEQAITLDPEFALARVEYAYHLLVVASTGGSPRQLTRLAREEARKALELDPTLSEANALMGGIAGNCEYDWTEAERQFRLALARQPVPPMVRAWFAWSYLLPMGRTKETIAMYQEVLKQDPLNVRVRYAYSGCLMAAGRRTEAESELHQSLEIEPRYFPGRCFLAMLLGLRGEHEEALQQAEAAYEVAPHSALAAGALAAALRLAGQTERSAELVRKMQESPSPYELVTFYTFTGDADRAADCLEEYIEERIPAAAQHFRVAQAFNSSPRWATIAKKMNLLE